ncbi:MULTISPECIES: UPF0158 family protein [Pseudomonas]|uniref:UPF0158 family protein n=1 Tax=Pseudomonas TaxID=286 RepID=UPI0018D71E1E|nr:MULTISPECIES: UPF0158 family protein [Pseudomonas]MBH3372453.1 hypothetical protein [Pseudomonas juntendi]CAH0648117.1 hypothetical protein PSNVIR_02375 [Pseudomonas sp. Nvir]
MDDLQHILQLIHELLSDQPYELSARLKQRLNIALIERGMSPLDQNSYGCKKFSEFLLTHMGDRIEIARPEVSGDLRISLKRDRAQARAKAISVEAKPKQDHTILMRSDVWQAFTNPDSNRKRYFDKVSHKILHFLKEGDEDYKAKLAERPQDFIEIEWIPASQQLAWMAEFLDLINLPVAERAPLQQLIEATYSSKVNAAFTKALGDREQEWRQMRTLKIAQWIQAWAVKHDVKPEELNLAATPAASCPPQPDAKATVMSSREQALRLLERMSDEDIAQYAIPVLLSSVLSKSQL